jgi:hypothetical protein
MASRTIQRKIAGAGTFRRRSVQEWKVTRRAFDSEGAHRTRSFSFPTFGW